MYVVTYPPLSGEALWVREEFPTLPPAELRAATLGLSLPYVKVIDFFWEEVHVAAFGAATRHTITRMPYAPLKLWCECGYRTNAPAMMDRHQKLAAGDPALLEVTP